MKSSAKFLLLFVCLVCAQTARADWAKRNLNTLAWLHDVYFLNEKDGWIVGSGGAFFKTTDGGATWAKNENLSSGDTIRQVYFTDAANGWLLCERDLYTLGANSPSYLLKTANGGATWERVELADSQRKRVTKFFFNETGAGFAVGEGGSFFALSADKKTWKRQPSPMRYLMFDGVFTDAANGVAVGAGSSILFTGDAGLSWTKASVLGASDAKFNSVFFINQRNGWTVGAGGKIFQTVNGGKTWREQKSAVTRDLTDIYFTDTAHGWAIGDEGTILYTATAGNVWTTLKPQARHRLERVFFVGKKGWAVGFGGTILAYDEGSENADSSVSPPKLRATI